MGSTQYYEKNSGLSALFQNAPIYAHVNVKAGVIPVLGSFDLK